jgi:hypothetical protein
LVAVLKQKKPEYPAMQLNKHMQFDDKQLFVVNHCHASG